MLSAEWSVRRATCLVLAAAALSASVTAAQTPGRGPTKHDVVVDGHHVAVWQRAPAGLASGRILLIHGRTWSSLPNFDLQVPGEQRSFMTMLNERGLDVYAVDLRGYGATPRDATGFLTPDRAVADVAAVLSWMQEDARKGRKVYLMGLSRGAMIAALVAQKYPDRVAGVILLGFGFDPDVRAARTDRKARPLRLRNTADAAASDFITPDAYSGPTLSAFVKAALQNDPVLADWRDEEQFNTFSPSQMQVPALLVHGDRDTQAPTAVGAKLFARFATADKWWIILPGADHAAHLEKAAGDLVRAILSFVQRHDTGRS